MTEHEQFVIVDRYSATCRPYPNPETVCEGQCEGMGCIPALADDPDPRVRALWHDIENRPLTQFEKARRRVRGEPDDPYHFVMCPDCNGTGKRPVAARTDPKPETP